MKILVSMPRGTTRDSFIPPEIVKKLESIGSVNWNESSSHFTSDELRNGLFDTDVLITGWGCGRLERYVLEGNDRLMLVAHTGGTVAPIVSDYLYEKGIKVISGNRFYAESAAEGALAYILCSLRDIPRYAREMQEDGWCGEDYYNEGLFDRTIGLVGFGMIAQELVRMLKPFRMKIKVHSRHIKDETLLEYDMVRAGLEEVITTSDIISVHASKRPETYHMIGKELLGKIPDGALLVNTARGSIIDENALAEELKKGRFKAALDVYEEEPLPMDSGLRGLPNVLLIPHMAGPTIDRRKFVTLGLMEDFTGYFAGNTLKHEISREYAKLMTDG